MRRIKRGRGGERDLEGRRESNLDLVNNEIMRCSTHSFVLLITSNDEDDDNNDDDDDDDDDDDALQGILTTTRE